MRKQMNKIKVTNIQRLCVHDGPGVRTTVFLKGCTLQCPWCCNPEAIHPDTDLWYEKGSCMFPHNSNICRNCEKHNGSQKIMQCPIHAFEPTYKEYTIDEISQILLKDKDLYGIDGGVTFSGGEPLIHVEALQPLLEILKANNVNIAFETTLYVPTENVELALQYANYWLIDLKFQYGYIHNQDYSVPHNAIYANLKKMQDKAAVENIVYRMVMMREALKNSERLIEMLRECKIPKIELLEYHSLAESKYHQLGWHFHRFTVPSKEEWLEFAGQLHQNGIEPILSKI